MQKPNSWVMQYSIMTAGIVAFWSSVAVADIDIDLARFVPNDVGFYAEFRDLSTTRKQFEAMGIWKALRGYAEGDVAVSNRWQRQTEQSLGITGDELIRDLLGHRAAIFSTSPAEWQDGVIIAQLTAPSKVTALLRRWGVDVNVVPDSLGVYQIGESLNCATRDDIMILGRVIDENGGDWERSKQLLIEQSRSHLAGRSEFAALRSHLPESPGGMLFAKWSESDRFALLGCRTMMAGFYFESHETRCRLVGHLNRDDQQWEKLPDRFWSQRPQDEMAFWASNFNNRENLLAASGPAFASDSMLANFFNHVFPQDGERASLGRDVGPHYLISSLRREDRTRPRLPDTALAFSSTAPEKAVQAMESIIVLVGNLIRIMAPGAPANKTPVKVERSEVGDRSIFTLPWGDLLAMRSEFSFLKPIHLAWAHESSVVGLATSPQALVKTLDALQGDLGNRSSNNNASVWRRFDERSSGVVECGYLHGREWSAVLSSWMIYVEKNHAQLANDAWWQIWAAERMVRDSHLGIGLADTKSKKGVAEVREINVGSPAQGRLMLGDLIVGAAGRALDRRMPARSVAQRYTDRGSATTFSLIVVRNDKRMQVDLSVPPSPNLRLATFRPVSSARKIIQLLRRINTVSYMRYQARAGWLDAEVIVDWMPSD